MIRHRLRLWPVVSAACPHRAPVRRKLRVLALEHLEHRVLLSGNPTVYTVTDTSDNNTGSGTSGDLLYCITQANANTNTAGSLIQFDPTVFSNSNPKTITLAATLELKENGGPEVIQEGGGTIETPEAVTISGNNTVGVFLVDPGVTATLSGLIIANGQASAMGGGIENSGTLTVFNCTIENNTAQFGGGLYNNGTLTVTANTYIQNNVAKAGLGGGIYNDGATVTVGVVGNPTFILNNSANRGGGIDNDNGGTLTVTGSDLSGNQAKRGGGLINTATSTVTISDSVLLDCGASGTTSNGSGGAGFYSSGTGSMTGCTVMRNTAEGSGGGIFVGGGALTITNSTVADNSLSAPMGAGAGVQEKAGTLVAVNCTIAYNSLAQGDSGNGGGIDVLNGTATVDNTIISLNTDGTGPDAQPDNFYVNGGGSVSPASANNLIGIGDGNSGLKNGANGNLVGVADPGIGTPFENGGPTYSIALFPGSPAIGAGSVPLAVNPQGKPLTTDQRGSGFPRIVNGKVDIGAFERPATVGSPTDYTVNLTSATGAGSGNEGDLAYVLLQARGNANLAGSVIQFDPTVFSTTTPQTITLSNTLELNEPSGPEMIDGPGASALTITGDKSVQVFLVDSGVMATLSGLTISGGSASEGGAIYIENGGTLAITDATIANSSASFGGGIYNNGRLAVSNSAVENNAQAGYGGGIFNDPDGKLTVTNSLIAGNSASQEGGGIASGGTATVINTTIVNNSAGGGGGIYSFGTLTVAGSTIAGSSAQSGGGISNIGGMTTVINTTVANNSASIQGGGIDNEFNAALVAINATIADNNVGNVGGKGGGLWNNASSTAALYNTIVALNTAGTGTGATPDDIANQSNAPVSGSFNLIGNGGSGELMNGANGNQVGVADPGLDPNGLQNNGGPTQTIALLASSPAIGAGSTTLAVDAQGHALATDQRGVGFARVVDGGVDIGAFESQTPVVTGLSPAQVQAGSPGPITLTVTGAAFMSQSVVDWNSAPLATTYVSSTELTATVPASDLASAGKNTITVTNPAIDGGTSSGVTFQVVNSPTPTPPSTPELILDVEPVFRRKTNRKHKPVGKRVLTGFLLHFSAPLDPAAASNPANYEIDLLATKRARKSVKRILHPLSNFTVSYAPSKLAVALNLGSTQTFPTGGQITVLAGVTSGSGTVLEGTTKFTVSKGGKSVAAE
jgi:hypothetical protein